MHANTNSIKFDFEEAEKFHAALRTCKTTLETRHVTEMKSQNMQSRSLRVVMGVSSLVILTVSLRWEQSSSSPFETPKII